MNTEYAKQYEEMQRTDVRVAFQTAVKDISSEQEKLRSLDKDNSLLKVITVPTQNSLSFSGDFQDVIFSNTGAVPQDNLYYGIGLYVGLLEKESQRLQS